MLITQHCWTERQTRYPANLAKEGVRFRERPNSRQRDRVRERHPLSSTSTPYTDIHTIASKVRQQQQVEYE